jgi:hypothetical protein
MLYRKIESLKIGILIISSLAFIGGCAASASFKMLKPTTVRLAVYKTVLLNVSSQIEDTKEEIVQLEKMTFNKLHDINLFDRIDSKSSSKEITNGLQLDIKITKLERVSPTARFLVGAFAGQAEIAVDVDLLDLKTKQIIGSFKLLCKSSGGNVFAGTTDDAIELTAIKIADFVKKNI